MAADLIVDLRSRHLPGSIGIKARNLRWLIDVGFKVPPTLICCWEAHQLYMADWVELVDQLRSELVRKIQPNTAYAVRSSANLEDRQNWSFAGQFKSSLDIQGEDHILRAIWATWAMACSDRVQTYLQKQGLDSTQLKMAVLIQQMVKPVISGVIFSRNPVNGVDEIIVEAVEGSGENLLQAGHTPQRWVYARGTWTSRPEDDGIPVELIDQVVKQTRRIADLRKKPVDLEWVFNGEEIYWVQLREITTLSHVKIYSNTIAKDILPGMIKPLVWSVNIPMVTHTWVQLLTELLGPNDIDPEGLVKAFYYRTYFEMSTFARIFNRLGLPSETLELMMDLRQAQKKMPMFRPNWHMVRLLPGVFSFIVDKTRFAHKVKVFLPRMQSAYQELYLTDAHQLGDGELLNRIQRLIDLTGETAYYNIVVPLLMQVYNAILRRNVTQAGADFTSLELLEGMDQIHEYDPGGYLLHLHELYTRLPQTFQTLLAAGEYTALQQTPELEIFRASFQSFLDRFGHLSESGNDFSIAPWREQPSELLKMVARFKPQPLQPSQKPKLLYEQVHFPWWKGPMVGKIYQRARSFRLYREQVSSLYTFGYGLLRVYFMALGIHFTSRGILSDPQDIFFLNYAEVQLLAGGSTDGPDYAALIAQRRNEMERCQSFVSPEIIYGEQVPPMNISISRRLQGTPTSRGIYTGNVAVVRSLADFSKMRPGAVLVIPYSDVGWTPLFIQAGGVISESGGMLSHSSIIAREYGIPAVVSVPLATYLPDEALVTVDGFCGEIIVHSTP